MIRKMISAFVRDEDGAAMSEYLVLLVVVVVALAGVGAAFVDDVNTGFQAFGTWLTNFVNTGTGTTTPSG